MDIGADAQTAALTNCDPAQPSIQLGGAGSLAFLLGYQ